MEVACKHLKDGAVLHGGSVYAPKDGAVLHGGSVYAPKDGNDNNKVNQSILIYTLIIWK